MDSDRERPTAKTDVKNSQRVNNNRKQKRELAEL